MREFLLPALRKLVIFHGLGDAGLAKLAEGIRISREEPGTVICREGEPGDTLFLILKGRVGVEKTASGGTAFGITELSDGDSFGEMCLIDVQPRSATIRTLEETSLAAFPYAAFLKLSEEDLFLFSTVLLNIAREFSRRLRRMDGRLVEFLQQQPDQIRRM